MARNSDKKLRKNIMLRPELDAMLKETAGKYKISESRVIENALVKFIAEETESPLPPFFEYSGVFECEHRNLSTTHKKIKPRKK